MISWFVVSLLSFHYCHFKAAIFALFNCRKDHKKFILKERIAGYGVVSKNLEIIVNCNIPVTFAVTNCHRQQTRDAAIMSIALLITINLTRC